MEFRRVLFRSINPQDPQSGNCNVSEVKRQRKDKFQTNWLRMFPWLELNTGEMSCSMCKMYGAAPFTSRCYKTSTLRCHSDGASHTAALKRKREANLTKKAVANAIEVAQLHCEEETKGASQNRLLYSRN